ncbi:MAG TPA: BioY family transporter, partial [Arthrobacter bacterium]|nr:BioY family transporter [Arthrobacter sp.]
MSQTGTAVTGTPSRLRNRWNATDLGLIAVFAALVAGSALVPGITANVFGVPITFQTLAVMLTGLMLGPGRGFAAVGLYTLLGLAGLPIFSQGRSGLGILAGPSAGYIIAFPIAAAVVGWLATVVIRRTSSARALWFFAAAMVTSIVFVHTLGVAGIALNTKASLGEA